MGRDPVKSDIPMTDPAGAGFFYANNHRGYIDGIHGIYGITHHVTNSISLRDFHLPQDEALRDAAVPGSTLL